MAQAATLGDQQATAGKQPLEKWARKGLLAVFGAATVALGGCATTQPQLSNTCMSHTGSLTRMPFFTRDTRQITFNEECAAAKAATIIGSMRREDGSADLEMYTFAISMYEASNATIRAHMERMLKERGTSIDEMKFEVENAGSPVVCVRAPSNPDNPRQSSYSCMDKETYRQSRAAPAAANANGAEGQASGNAGAPAARAATPR